MKSHSNFSDQSGGTKPLAQPISPTAWRRHPAAEDPVRRGLVASLAQPGGNLTGINFLTNELLGKRLEPLRELVPTAARVEVLRNPSNTASTEIAAFASFVRERPDALFRRAHLTELAARHRLPAIYDRREIAMNGGPKRRTAASTQFGRYRRQRSNERPRAATTDGCLRYT